MTMEWDTSLVLNPKTSPIFASGYINGYFSHQVPDIFFRLLVLYIVNNQLSSIPWAIPFGEGEVNTMLKITKDVLAWYDDFKTHIPNWYTHKVWMVPEDWLNMTNCTFITSKILDVTFRYRKDSINNCLFIINLGKKKEFYKINRIFILREN